MEHVWRESYRVLKKGGVLLAGFSNPMVYLFEDFDIHDEVRVAYKLPYNPLKSCTDEELKVMTENDGIQFSHSLEDQIGSQLNVGFCLTDLYEDYHSEDVSARYAPTYIATRAIKK